MKRLILVFIGVSLLSTATVFAQEEMTEKEKKAAIKTLMKKLKGMDGAEAQKMFDDYPSLSGKVSSLESEVSSLQSDLSSKDSEISSLKSDLQTKTDSLNMFVAPPMASSDTTEDGSTTAPAARSTARVTPGLVYKIQIGAFRNADLTKYFDNNPNFGGEVDADGTKKYTIGVFGEYWEADTFKKYMRQMGVKDAWIVPYHNGNRVSMKDAREGAL